MRFDFNTYEKVMKVLRSHLKIQAKTWLEYIVLKNLRVMIGSVTWSIPFSYQQEKLKQNNKIFIQELVKDDKILKTK